MRVRLYFILFSQNELQLWACNTVADSGGHDSLARAYVPLFRLRKKKRRCSAVKQLASAFLFIHFSSSERPRNFQKETKTKNVVIIYDNAE